MCDFGITAIALTALSGVMTGVGQIQQAAEQQRQAQAAAAQAQYQAQVQRNAAKVAEWKAADAKKRGEQEVERINLKSALTTGQQVAAFASQGTDFSGSVVDLVGDTGAATEFDVLTARNNAERQAWEENVRGVGLLAEADLSEQKARNYKESAYAISSSTPFIVGSTLASTAGSVAGKWYQYKNSSVPNSGSGWV